MLTRVTPRISSAVASDVDFVRRLSASVFARFGDYEGMLPWLMGDPRMRTAIAWSGTTRIGFAMYVPVDEVPGELDLVAIAVEPAWQTSGVGRALLAFVEDEAGTLAGGRAPSVRLTVAEDNTAARRLFEGTGYRPIDGEHGLYDGGQRSMGLRKRLR